MLPACSHNALPRLLRCRESGMIISGPASPTSPICGALISPPPAYFFLRFFRRPKNPEIPSYIFVANFSPLIVPNSPPIAPPTAVPTPGMRKVPSIAPVAAPPKIPPPIPPATLAVCRPRFPLPAKRISQASMA
ncbi:hypothetical protein D3C75_660410 [compost metagenome]